MYDIRTIALATALGLGCGALLGNVTMSSATAAPIAAEEESKVETGSIKSVDAANSRFVLAVNERDVTIRINGETQYTLDGAKSTMAEALKAGSNARVTHKDHLATLVAVSSPRPAPGPE